MKAPELHGFIGTLLETEHDTKKPGQSPALRSEKTGSEPSREILAGDVLSLRGEL
jgi:hypothetical protein